MMTKQELLDALIELSADNNDDFEESHKEADRLLIKYINDKEIADAYNRVGKWYS